METGGKLGQGRMGKMGKSGGKSAIGEKNKKLCADHAQLAQLTQTGQVPSSVHT
jgi:hypothetical protein